MLITVSHLTKSNNLKCMIDDVSFTINETDKIAFIGINGTGKSTLLKILAGEEDYQGDIIRKKDLNISYLPQNPNFNNDCTVFQQVSELLENKVNDYEIKSILNQLGIIEHNQKIGELSGGQKRRVALAITLLKPCDLLLLDEPTNHLDSEMIEFLENYLIKWNKALFMVTHDRYFMERITNKIWELDRTKIYQYEGHYSQYLELKQQREETILTSQHKRKQFLKKELEWVRAGVQARSTKSKDRLQRFQELSAIVDQQKIKNIQMIDTASRLGNKTIELINISMSYDYLLFEPFSYHFKRFDRIGILGQNGCGKTTLLNIIAGTLKPITGKVVMGETVRIGYFKQGYEVNDDQRVIDYIKETANVLQTSEGTLTAKQMCERFLFDKDLQYSYINRLSGGEKRRLYLLKTLMSGPNVLLLDEPTNDLDIMTLQIFEDYLDHFSGIIIVVSHDRYFLDRICNGLFVFKNKQIQYMNGGYSASISISEKSTKIKKKDTRIRQNKPKLTYQQKHDLENLEITIPKLEKELLHLDEQMNGISDYNILLPLLEKRNDLEKQIAEANNYYLELLEIES
ncbi:MAG: ABC-F family ATP-binding cassette domain-containing protein [Erysipelotrichaceae bacterium]|nr:ABC-F family ATP-binding cassette domain-containing protein [Erysipelotrichaceae bacterium]